MSLYADAEFPVRQEIVAAHTRQLENIAAPGTWYTGSQRLAIAAEARLAGYDAGLLERPDRSSNTTEIDIPDTVRRVVSTIAVSVRELNQDFYDQALADGLTEAEYVEIVGIVSRVVDLDVFARGIGASPRELPAPKAGKPSRQLPGTAVVEHAWVPTVPNGPEGGEIGQALYHGQPMPYIVRALSLVPAELSAHVELEIAHYTRLDKLFDYDYQHHEGLTRPQVEVVAGRVSAINDCFY
jgi:hypothetical protein